MNQGSPGLRWHMLDHPLRDTIHLRDVIGARILVSPSPAVNLPLDITFGPPKIAQPGQLEINSWQNYDSVNRALGKLAQREGRGVQCVGTLDPQNPACDPVHAVKRCADDGIIFAEQP